MADAIPPTRLLVIRHGESNVTVQGVFGGMKSCTGLSPLGREQAQRLRDRFAAGHEPAIDELWASNMPRAIETAEIANEALGLDLRIEPGFEEMRPGDVDGMAYGDYLEAFGMPDQLAEPYKPLAPNGDSRATFFLRVGEAFGRLIESRPNRTHAIFCHGGVVDAVFRQLLGIHSELPFQLHTMNTSITEFVALTEQAPRRWLLVRYNDEAHLAGLPRATPRTTDSER